MSGRDIVSEHDTVKGGKALESATTKVTAWRLYVIDLHGSDCRTTTWLRVTSWLRSRRQSLGSTDSMRADLYRCSEFYIIYIMRNRMAQAKAAALRRLRWIWLWITSCLPQRPPSDTEIEA